MYFDKEGFVFQFMKYRTCVGCDQNASLVISSLVVLTDLMNKLFAQQKQGLEYGDNCTRWTDRLFKNNHVRPALNILSHSVLVPPHFHKHEIHLHIQKRKKQGGRG